MNIKIHQQHFVLHPLGAVYWPEQEMLLIADVHLGKVSHFRKFGSAIPMQVIEQNFVKLNQLLRSFDPEHVVFLGDLFHSSMNNEWHLFSKWATSIDHQIHLVIGNHDIISPLKYEEIGVLLHSRIRLGNFLLTHHPETLSGYFNICGHIHPGYKMRGIGRQLLKLPCFHMKKQQLVLPAFGEFTGNYFMEPEEEDRIFAITGKKVILVS